MAMVVVLVLGLLPAGAVAERPVLDDNPVPTPPGQREAGPGGQDYVYERVSVKRYGEGADGYWVLSPDKPGDRSLPVLVFVHGLNQTHYAANWLWLRHLVLRGAVVVFPQYQTLGAVDPTTFTAKAGGAVRDAIKRLGQDERLNIDTQRFAMVGHSLGGTIIVNLAARHEHFGLPRPKALMPVLPGDTRALTGLGALLPGVTEDHRTVHANTLMLIIASDNDRFVGKGFAERIYKKTKHIDPDDKDLIVLSSDTHGSPALVSDHFIPSAYTDGRGRDTADAYDFALWRWFDALVDAAFEDGKNKQVALGDTPEQRDLGKWSDGTPVREPEVLDPQ